MDGMGGHFNFGGLGLLGRLEGGLGALEGGLAGGHEGRVAEVGGGLEVGVLAPEGLLGRLVELLELDGHLLLGSVLQLRVVLLELLQHALFLLQLQLLYLRHFMPPVLLSLHRHLHLLLGQR